MDSLTEQPLDLRNRALDAALGAMARNRALLFTINMVAAAVLITVFLERQSFDDLQREHYLFAVQEIKNELTGRGLPASSFGLDRAHIEQIENWAFECWTNGKVANKPNISIDKAWKESVSRQLYRLHRVHNDLSQVALPSTQWLPIGVSVPRNDLVPIAGLLLLILYSWLCFSFRQLAGIILVLRRTFVGDKGAADAEGSARFFRDVIELHFLFRTSKRGLARFFVKGLYYSPPIVMIIALLNDVASTAGVGDPFQGVLLAITTVRTVLVAGLCVALGFIAYQITLADRDVNLASFGQAILKD